MEWMKTWDEVLAEFKETGGFHLTPTGGDLTLPAPDGYEWVFEACVGPMVVLREAPTE